MLVNAVCYAAISGALSAVAFTWLMSVIAFAGCRLMLNMHALASPRAQTPYTTREREADRAMHDTHLDFGGSTALSEWMVGSGSGLSSGTTEGGRDAYEMKHMKGRGSAAKGKGKEKESVFGIVNPARSPSSSMGVTSTTASAESSLGGWALERGGSKPRHAYSSTTLAELQVHVRTDGDVVVAPFASHSLDVEPSSPMSPLSGPSDPLLKGWTSRMGEEKG